MDPSAASTATASSPRGDALLSCLKVASKELFNDRFISTLHPMACSRDFAERTFAAACLSISFQAPTLPVPTIIHGTALLVTKLECLL